MVSVRKNQIDELGEADTRHLPAGSLRPEAILLWTVGVLVVQRCPTSPSLCFKYLAH
jgi:hypothetical protein